MRSSSSRLGRSAERTLRQPALAGRADSTATTTRMYRRGKEGESAPCCSRRQKSTALVNDGGQMQCKIDPAHTQIQLKMQGGGVLLGACGEAAAAARRKPRSR